MFRFYKVPQLVMWGYPSAIWKIKTTQKEIFLTFDDGPTPNSTFEILELLDNYHAKATWFCLGGNLKSHPSIADTIISKGHLLGNHAYYHESGWKTSTAKYLANVELCQKELNRISEKARLFRPPYGEIKYAQLRLLKEYKIYMWSHISWDFDPNLDIGKSINKMTKAPTGSILLFHDQIKSVNSTKIILEAVLKHFTNQGYQFKVLPT
ncbi:MAG: polysaccharide deacetylase family protein [Cyclobacteriaceae bacterium]